MEVDAQCNIRRNNDGHWGNQMTQSSLWIVYSNVKILLDSIDGRGTRGGVHRFRNVEMERWPAEVCVFSLIARSALEKLSTWSKWELWERPMAQWVSGEPLWHHMNRRYRWRLINNLRHVKFAGFEIDATCTVANHLVYSETFKKSSGATARIKTRIYLSSMERL